MGGYGGVAPGTEDWTDPMAAMRLRRLNALNSVSQDSPNLEGAFDPEMSDVHSGFLRERLPYGAQMPSLGSSGISGMGMSGQPQADLSTSGPRASAGAALADKQPPPGGPGQLSQMAPVSPGMLPRAASPGPLAKNPPPDDIPGSSPVSDSPGGAGVAPSAPSRPVDLSESIRKAQDRSAAAHEATAKGPGTNWAQRLGFAILSLTRLAPVANQIIHPKYMAQLSEEQRADENLKELVGEQEQLQRGQQLADTVEGRKEQARIAAEARKDVADTNASARNEATRKADADRRLKLLLHGREEDAVYQPQGAPVQPGFDVINDPEHPGYVYVVPPAARALTEEEARFLPGRKAGDIATYSELKSIRDTYQKSVIQKADQPKSPPPPEQRFIDEYLQTHPGSNVADAVTAYSKATQHDQQPPQALMFGPDGKAMLIRPGMTIPKGAQTVQGVNAVNTPTSQSRGMSEMASTVLEQVPTLLGQIDSLKEKIGPGAGRWNDLWVNKAGLNDPDFAGLDQDLDLFASALVRTHFGARGGQGYREALKKNFSMAQSPDDLKARIQHAEQWIKGYANIGAPAGARAGTTGGTAPKMTREEIQRVLTGGK